MEINAFEVSVPSENRRLNLETIPTKDGDLLSIASLWKKRLIPAKPYERKLGITFSLTDVITDIISIAKQLDSGTTVTLDYIKGFFKQEIGITLRSSYFTITLEKRFNHGTNTGDIMHYLVAVTVACMYREYYEMLVTNIRQKCPRPLFTNKY